MIESNGGPVPPTGLLAFGPYELNAQSGELRKSGVRIRLASQPLKVLLVLLAHPGDLVTREQLRAELWTGTTFVDFEHGLNAAMNKVRRALGDSAENPRYIETIHSRGYRFIGNLERPLPTPIRSAIASTLQPPSPSVSVDGRWPRRWPWVAGAATLVIMAAVAGLWHAGGSQEQPQRVVPLTTSIGSEYAPSFSPDGKQVVFAWNGEKQDKWDLYVKMIGAATALRLTTDAADDMNPAWSPDGRQIAFVKGGQHPGIYSISPLGGPEQKIADFDAGLGPPTWSPDGKFLIVAKNHTEQKPTADADPLFLIPAQGGEPQPFLSPMPGRWYAYPAFSPAGRSLAFASCQSSTSSPYCDVLAVGVNADLKPQAKPRKLTAASTYIYGMAWTPDGRSLIYSAGTSKESFLFRIDPTGGGDPKRLEIASEGALFPAVALKGNRLAFSRGLQDSDIWRLQAGDKPQPFLASTAFDGSAQFSPDGRSIAFASARAEERIAIWLANTDGGRPVQLTRGPEDFHASPRWSPDGRWIAFDAQGKDGRWNIKVVESSGGQPRQLTRNPFDSTVPTWSHDGKWIYFGSDRSGRFDIWRMPAQGGEPTQITRNGGYVAVESPDAKTLYYTKTGGDGPLFTRPLWGGEEKQVLDGVARRAFAVFEDGIYYVYRGSPGAATSEIRFHEFATGRSHPVGLIERGLGLYLSVSPDRKTFLFTGVTSAGTDLMLIENFR